MKRLIIIVEGDTEKEFINTMLTPFFNAKGLYHIDCFKIKHSKGGISKYGHVKKDIINTVYETDAVVTTLIDYYALPYDFPKFDESKKYPEKDERLNFLENAIREDIETTQGRSFNNLLPYIQLHEFEALIFSSISGIQSLYESGDANYEEFSRIMRDFPNPEDINDGSTTAPSKRLKSLIKGYNKVIDGILILEEIGLDPIRQKCQRFNDWLNKLEQIINLK